LVIFKTFNNRKERKRRVLTYIGLNTKKQEEI